MKHDIDRILKEELEKFHKRNDQSAFTLGCHIHWAILDPTKTFNPTKAPLIQGQKQSHN